MDLQFEGRRSQEKGGEQFGIVGKTCALPEEKHFRNIKSMLCSRPTRSRALTLTKCCTKVPAGSSSAILLTHFLQFPWNPCSLYPYIGSVVSTSYIIQASVRGRCLALIFFEIVATARLSRPLRGQAVSQFASAIFDHEGRRAKLHSPPWLTSSGSRSCFPSIAGANWDTRKDFSRHLSARIMTQSH